MWLPLVTSLDDVLTLCTGLVNLSVVAGHVIGHFSQRLRHACRGEDGNAGPSGAELDAKDDTTRKGSEHKIGILSRHSLVRLELDSSGAGSTTQPDCDCDCNVEGMISTVCRK